MTFAETEETGLKQKLSDSLPKEIVTFLNTDGGTIYIGVNDDGSICGVSNLDDSLKKIADILESQILPDSHSFVELGTKFIDQKHVIEIKVQKGDSLYYIKKYGRSLQGCFIRVGSTSRSMTEEQINIVHNKYLDSKVKITEIASAIKSPSFQYLKLLLTEKGFSINEATFAENFHLLTKDGEYNKMAELLADKNEVSIKVVRFKGKSKADGIALRNEYGEKCLVVAMKQNLSKEDFFRGVSKPVNEELAKLFIRLDLMEQTGYGIPLVTEKYGKDVFEFLDFFLRVTIPFAFEIEAEEQNGTQGGTQDGTQGDTQENDFDLWLESQIRNNPRITTEELSQLCGKGVRTIKRHISKLGHIRYVGSGYSGHWEIIDRS
ncbi:MAG: putative DNA binding domain-containing protein [Spirochaetaceae bacterium]|nr:putative DNA binding domain-containing protein [Spirochaetaceae bacterium]